MIKKMIKENILKEFKQAEKNANFKYFFVIDKNVFLTYKNIFKDFNDESFIVIEALEKNKNLDTVCLIYEKLMEGNYTRSDYLIAVGGGIIGDVSGFVSATYMRGMKLIHIPTTLLAMVDSSIGSKTGFNYLGYKNMIGTFYSPEKILVDVSFLKTLNDYEYRNGMAEIIKIAAVRGAELFHLLESGNISEDEKIAMSQNLKQEVVNKDLKDLSDRHSLNFGHSLAHAIESLCACSASYTGGQIRHGYAVSMGMAEIMRLSLANKLCSSHSHDRLINLLKAYHLPTEKPFTNKELFEYIKLDKKKSGKTNKIVICPEIGTYKILEFTDDELKDFLEI